MRSCAPRPTGALRRCMPAPLIGAVAHHTRRSGRVFARPRSFSILSIEVVNIPYENGRTMPGYFVPGGPAGEKRPTVLVLGGGDSALEELYGAALVGAQRRGYNCSCSKFPAKGRCSLTIPTCSSALMPRSRFGHVVDYVLSRPEVDPNRIALVGGSLGGYFAPRAAAFEKRLAAVIALPLVWDVQVMMTELLGLDPTKPYPLDLESHLGIPIPC